MDRTIKSTSTVEKSTAEFNGWELDFTKNESTEGSLTINVFGRKGENTVNANLSDNGSTSITFRNEVDKDLMDELLDEIEGMKS